VFFIPSFVDAWPGYRYGMVVMLAAGEQKKRENTYREIPFHYIENPKITLLF